ncbi:type III-B CRISPR module RAMP protein Cmr1 [Thermosipho ferrireducens]|uniref:Type III-B CRISPR module RAMP protein Cmr1 n=1 Tax=Thermosipho ferrireducens TaxID=2571116 RepID=A0ABX7S6G2_9BACT|nr:type III-B CRISPR module RAMP protein Cmr1 [Thermosipho ferrireducens]QTA38169.1 type III-B CRISPR module RAMP protein Cmr1 [Thermosipho ferrireducens]
MQEITVKFRTITPLWTGNAWGKCDEIKPAALIGSLRFWFEVICYFSGVVSGEDFDTKLGRFEREVDSKKFKGYLSSNGNSFKDKIKGLLNQNIPLPSIIFGTTNWESLIKIKHIEPIGNYCFGNKLNIPKKICINKNGTNNIKENQECPNRSNNGWSVFYFNNPYFYGQFRVKFLVNESILNEIFYPLLNFMDKYGYWGGKWNIGYGRLKIEKVEFKNKGQWYEREISGEYEFKFSNLHNMLKDKKFINLITNSPNFDNLITKKTSLYILENQFSKNDFKSVIKELLKIKSKKRGIFRNDKEFRHKVFGKTGREDYLPQGSKILPYIYEENGQYHGGFLSIAGLLNLQEETK